MTENTFSMMLIRKRSQEYYKADKSKKGDILDQLEKDTGRHRKSIIRTLNSRKDRSGSSPPGRPKKYTRQAINLIELVWKYNDYVAAERFHSSIDDTLNELESDNELKDYDRQIIDLVRHIPMGTLKYKLRKIPRPRRKSGKMTASEVKKQIPIRTGFQTNISYGFFAMDFVDHTGGDPSGKFGRTLCGTDPKSTWIARGSCLGKERSQVEQAWDIVAPKIPYKIKGMHSDNEPNLLYTTLGVKAKQEEIGISRSRSFHKEDNGHVEQKNGDKVRNLVGYRRYDRSEEVELLNRIYAIDDLYQNHFIASMRLESKEYDELGKLVKRKYSPAKTAYQRVMEDKEIPQEVKLGLWYQHKSLSRVKLKKQRDKLLKKLFNFR